MTVKKSIKSSDSNFNKGIKSLILAVLGSFSLLGSIEGFLSMPLTGMTYTLILFFIFLFVISKSIHKKFEISVLIYSIAFSFAVVSVKQNDYFFVLFEGNTNAIIDFIICVIGYVPLIYHIFVLIISKIENPFKIKVSVPNLADRFLRSRFGIFGIIFLIGLPFVVIFFPGGAFTDGLIQLDQFFSGNMTDHHPILTTILMGGVVKFGASLIDQNFGLFLWNFLQYTAFCAVTAYVVRKEYIRSRGIAIADILYYCFVPTFYCFAYFLVKDTIYAIIFTLYCYFYTSVFLSDEKELRRKLYALIALSVLLLFIRKEGVYIASAGLLGLIFFYLKKKDTLKRVLCGIALVLIFNTAYHNFLLPAFEIPEGSVKEMLNIPLQQTAAYIKYEPEDITEDEREILLELFNASELSDIGSAYAWDISDPIKDMMKTELSKEELKEYLSVWLAQGSRHPMVYLKALTYHISGYIFPEAYHMWWVRPGDIDVFMENYDYMEFHHPPVFESERNSISERIYSFARIPILSYLTSPATFTWIYLFLGVLMTVFKRSRFWLMLIPIFCVIGVCCLSPVGGYTRYFIHVEMALPVYIGAAAEVLRRRKAEKD